MELTTVKKKELQTLKINVATHMLEYDKMNEHEAIEAWHKVPELSRAFEDMAYGSILKHMKELLDRDSFVKFLRKVDMAYIRNGVAEPSKKVYNMMEFAGYKEEGGIIETASHYKEVKKVVGKDTKEIDKVYKELPSPKTAKDVKEQVQSRESAWLDDKKKDEELLREFLKQRPDLRVEPYEDKKIEIEVPTRAVWKKFMSKVSHCIHPDKGEDDELQSILNNINGYMKNETAKVNNKFSIDLMNKEFSIYKRGV